MSRALGVWAARACLVALGCAQGCTPAETGSTPQPSAQSLGAATAARVASPGTVQPPPPPGSSRAPADRAHGESPGTAARSEIAALLARCAPTGDPAGSDCELRLQQLAQRLALLEVDGRRREAAHVYFCRELGREGRERDPWRCRSELTHADDTLHLLELGPDQVVRLEPGARGRLVDVAGDVPPGLIKAGAGPALEMHADGYVAARRIGVSDDGTVALPEIPSDRDVLLFVLYRHDDSWVRKHVWLVRRAPGPPRSPSTRAPAPASAP